MLKNKFILAVAAASVMMLGSCSTGEDLDALAQVAQPEGDSEVEIKLDGVDRTASAGVSTRAAIMGDDDNHDANMQGLGIFGLAREKQNINDEPDDIISWFKPSEHGNWSSCIMKNVKANKEGKTISWANANAIYYYPITQFYAYDFYAYYPYVEDDKLIYGAPDGDENYVAAQMEIDGTNDVIWGRTLTSDQYAYSARYFRNPDVTSNSAHLDLYHMLTRLVFKVTPGESKDGSKDYDSALKMRVDSIYVLDAKSHVTLVIAELDREKADFPYFKQGTDERDNPTLPARITADDPNERVKFMLKSDGAEFPLPYDLASLDAAAKEAMKGMTADQVYQNYGRQVGESFMLFPQESYELRVVLSMSKEDGKELGGTGAYEKDNRFYFYSEIPLRLKPKADGVTQETFRRGFSYNIRVNIHGPRDITLDANLEPWYDVEGPTLEL